jgi:hypothetical protein
MVSHWPGKQRKVRVNTHGMDLDTMRHSEKASNFKAEGLTADSVFQIWVISCQLDK